MDKQSVTLIKQLSRLDGKILTQYHPSREKEISKAIRESSSALVKWRNSEYVMRGNILRKNASLLEENRTEIVNLVRHETGKSINDANSELDSAIEFCFLTASHGRRAFGEILPSSIDNRLVLKTRTPIGIAALIVGYNTPFPNYAWKVFPAIMGGNVAILKPSEFTSKSALLFLELLRNSGLPENVLQVVIGDALTAQLLAKSEIDLLSFTGSTKAGKILSEIVAPRMIRTILELGGSNSSLVLEDANLGEAADAIVRSAFSNSGQRCAAGSNVFVHRRISDDFKKQLLEAVDVYLMTNDIGDLVSESASLKYAKFLQNCREQNGIVYQFPKSGKINKVENSPALIFGLDSKSELARSEIFAPALRYFEFDDVETVIRHFQTSEYALTAAIWTEDLKVANRIANQFEVGLVNINGPTFGSEPQFPFGGFKNSGNSARDAGDSAIDQYTTTKIVTTFNYKDLL